ncbi:MAG: PHP domain-containing protein [Defluviitaleaceae bacterium]|nr:PHP domain-containing protein [Defluviitaleaceae bacterium]
MPYKFEPHAHTAESSGCANFPAKKLVEAYHAAGFDGIAITDHMYGYLLQRFKNNWNQCVDFFLKGYKNAKKRGNELGLGVILGMELSFAGAPGMDYLVYGIDENFLRKNSDLPNLHLKEFFRRYSDELLIIQAHPFRYGNEIVYHQYLHGVEIHNGNPRHINDNKKSRALCKSRPKLCPISASDTHEAGDVGRGWIELKHPVKDSKQLRNIILNREYELGKV